MLKKAEDKLKFDQSFQALRQEYINKALALMAEYKAKGVSCGDTPCMWVDCKVCPLEPSFPTRPVVL